MLLILYQLSLMQEVIEISGGQHLMKFGKKSERLLRKTDSIGVMAEKEIVGGGMNHISNY